LEVKVNKAVKDIEGLVSMSKRELIDCIKEINKTAKAQFLAMFSEKELADYLEHLMELDLRELVTC
jgi:helix-turn-helix protein